MQRYADGVIERHLPGDTKRLPADTALQNPADYLRVLSVTVPKLLRLAKVLPEQVIGLARFYSCTMLPAKADGTPLCFDRDGKRIHTRGLNSGSITPLNRANRINELGLSEVKHSSKPTVASIPANGSFQTPETVNHSPEIYSAADRFIEAGDWIVWQLCGAENAVSSRRLQGHARLSRWPARLDLSQPGFFKALHPRLENVVAENSAAKRMRWAAGRAA